MVTQRFTQPQSAEWKERALHRAHAAATLIGRGRGVRSEEWKRDANSVPLTLIVRVKSATIPHKDYDVIYDCVTDSAQCFCRAASYGRPCCHAGVALQYGRYSMDLYSR